MKGFFSSSAVQKEGPGGMVPKCGACGLYKLCQSPKMEVDGDGARGVMVVGEAPGETEDEEGRPFVGKAGGVLREALREAGINLNRDAWITNAVICRPPHNKTPDDEKIAYCRPNLLNAIKTYQPRVIVTLGRSALVSVLGRHWRDIGPLERWTGWRIPLAEHWVCPTYHPSYLSRMNNPLLDRIFRKDLKRAFALKSGPPAPVDLNQVEVLFDERKACEAIVEIHNEGGWVAVDYETNCLKPEYPKAAVHAFSISNGRRTVSFPWAGRMVELVGKFLRSPKTRKIASNLKFEERWTRRQFGHGVSNWGWDTMIATHCLDNRQGICSIKFQGLVRLGVPSYNEHIEPYLSSTKGHYNRIEEIEIGALLQYCGVDSLLEYKLARIQRREMGYED